MNLVFLSISRFQEAELEDEDWQQTVLHLISMVLRHKATGETRVTKVFDQQIHGIELGAALVKSASLPPSAVKGLSNEALDCASDILAWTFRWFDWYKANSEDIEEGRSNEVANVVAAVHKLINLSRPLLESCMHPVISRIRDFKHILLNDDLATTLEDREEYISLIQEVLGKREAADQFDIEKVPKFTNGDLKICWLNASFGLFLRIVPDIGEKGQTEKPLCKEIQKVLASTLETNLLGVKGALHAKHKEEPDYREGSQEGIAAEALKNMVQDFYEEVGQKCSFNHIMSEELGFLDKCAHCGRTLQDIGSLEPAQRLTCVQVSGGLKQQVVLQDEMAQTGWVGCLKCFSNETTASPASSAPKKVVLEFVGGAAGRLKGIDAKVNLGESTFQPTGIVHFDHQITHFWTSLKDANENWWRLDDHCGSEDLCRRQYNLRQGEALVTERGEHCLDSKVHLLLLEEVLDERREVKNIKASMEASTSRYIDLDHFCQKVVTTLILITV